MADNTVLYSQRDPRWAAEHYGLPQAARASTIGAYGCGITAIAQKLTLGGKSTTPATVQQVLADMVCFKRLGTFNFINWAMVPMAYPQLHYNGRYDVVGNALPANVMGKIKNRLQAHEAVIIYVDAQRYVAGLQQHFVLVTGTNAGGQLVIANPWNGRREDLRAYGTTDEAALRGAIWLDGFPSAAYQGG